MSNIYGIIKIYIKEKNSEPKLHFTDFNAISNGIAYSLANLFSIDGSIDASDYTLPYFQLGVGSLSGYFPTGYTNKNFYQLASALPASAYGFSSLQQINNLQQNVLLNGNFSQPIEFTQTSAAFVLNSINSANYLRGGYNTRIVVDRDLANGQSISEIGLFMKNPDGDINTDSPILIAYKSFPSISKTSDIEIIFDWSLFVNNGNIVGQEDSSGVGSVAQRITWDFLSGTGDNLFSDMNAERFELGIPSSFDNTNGAPLVIALHGAGQQMTQYRSQLNYTFSDGSIERQIDPLYDRVLERGWFYLAPLGKTTSSVYDDIEGELDIGALKNTQGTYYLHGNSTISNFHSHAALEHFRKVVKFILDRYPINKNKIYFIGFSMGGGCAASFASRLIDPSPSSFRCAAVVPCSPTLNQRRTWWEYAGSSQFASSLLWPTPKGNVLRSLGKPLLYWSVGDAAPSCTMQDFYPNNFDISTVAIDVSQNGAGWYEISTVTPSNAPFKFYEDTVVDYDLNTSAASSFSFSSCTYYNLRHIPTYLHYFTDDSQGGFIFEPANILSSILTNSGIHQANYLVRASSTADLSSIFLDVTGTHPSENHAVYTLNMEEALDFCASASLSAIYNASTIFTRDGRYWYFDIFNGPVITATSGYNDAVFLTYGLGLYVWSIDPTTNTLYVSASKNCRDTNNVHTIFNHDLAGFNITPDNILKIYNLSSTVFPVSADSGTMLIRRIGVPGYATPSQIRYFNYNGSSIAETGEVCTRSGSNWQAASVGTVAAVNGTELLIRRVGYYEITP